MSAYQRAAKHVAMAHCLSAPVRIWNSGGCRVHPYEDLLIDLLLDCGFTMDEALKLIALQTKLENMAAQARPWTLPIERIAGEPDPASLN
jgi:hypothetical protein